MSLNDTTNFLQETLTKLKDHEKQPSDVVWVGSRTRKITWDNFVTIADIKYDEGFGTAEIPKDMLVVGKDWWLERHEYDGSEWWEFKVLPTEPAELVKLDELNRADDF